MHATIAVPGSKSETNRALILAALAESPATITGGLDARDTQLMRAALRSLGVRIDDNAPAWTVTPPKRLAAAGHIDCGGTSLDCGPTTIECGLAGTVMRFLPPVAALAAGSVRFDGDEQAYARPLAPLLDALYDMGANVEPEATGLPFTMTGRPGLPGGAINIDSSASSQFISGLLLAGARYARGLDLRHVGPSLPSRPHIEMTVAALRERGVRVQQPEENRWVVEPGPISGGPLTIAPDLSNAAVFLAAASITQGTVTVPGWPTQTDQPGDKIREILTAFGSTVQLHEGGLTVTGGPRLNPVDLDLSDASELTPVVAALASVAHGTSHIRGVGHIRGHETDRLAALEAELNGLGSHTKQTDDGLVIHPRVLHGGEWHTYADHRMAHAGALLGLLVEGVTLDDIGCTSKTMPDFVALWTQLLAQSDQWSDSHDPQDREAEAGRARDTGVEGE